MLYVIYILSIVWTGDFVCRNANTRSQWCTLGTTNAFLSHQKNCSSGQRIFQCQKILNKRWQNHHLRGIDNWSYVRIRPRTNIYTKLLPPMFGNDLRMKWSNAEWNLIHGALIDAHLIWEKLLKHYMEHSTNTEWSNPNFGGLFNSSATFCGDLFRVLVSMSELMTSRFSSHQHYLGLVSGNKVTKQQPSTLDFGIS